MAHTLKNGFRKPVGLGKSGATVCDVRNPLKGQFHLKRLSAASSLWGFLRLQKPEAPAIIGSP